MSVYLYDQALVDKLVSVTGDDRIMVIPPSDTISLLAQINKDKVTFPAIVVTRGPIKMFTDTRNQVAYLKGETARFNRDSTATKMKLLPIRIDWTINIYAVDRYSCDEITRELVFYLMTYPRCFVNVPYGVDIPQNFDLILDPNIEDNSDLENFSNTGEYFRTTLSLYTENAHYFTSGKIYLTKIEGTDQLDFN